MQGVVRVVWKFRVAVGLPPKQMLGALQNLSEQLRVSLALARV